MDTAASIPDQQLGVLLARRDALGADIADRAAELVRAWLIERRRTWLAVEFTRTRPEPPFDGDASLVAAVANLPRRAFGSGLDVRGSFIVRLADLNAFLGYGHDEQRDLADGLAALSGAGNERSGVNQ